MPLNVGKVQLYVTFYFGYNTILFCCSSDVFLLIPCQLFYLGTFTNFVSHVCTVCTIFRSGLSNNLVRNWRMHAVGMQVIVIVHMHRFSLVKALLPFVVVNISQAFQWSIVIIMNSKQKLNYCWQIKKLTLFLFDGIFICSNSISTKKSFMLDMKRFSYTL